MHDDVYGWAEKVTQFVNKVGAKLIWRQTYSHIYVQNVIIIISEDDASKDIKHVVIQSKYLFFFGISLLDKIFLCILLII